MAETVLRRAGGIDSSVFMIFEYLDVPEVGGGTKSGDFMYRKSFAAS